MSELPSITSKNALREWLEVLSVEDAQIIALRAAMRAAPVWIVEMQSEWARRVDLTAIAVMRINLTSGVVRNYPNLEVRAAASYARRAFPGITIYDAADASAFPAANSALGSVAAAALSAANAAVGSADVAAFAITSSDVTRVALASADVASVALGSADAAARAAFWRAVDEDAQLLAKDGDPFEVTLWVDQNPLAAAWQNSHQILHDSPGGDFWIDWYQRVLDGRPQNWPLWRDVALIDNALWEEGGEALDREIKRLIEQHRLLEEVRRLKAELQSAQVAGIAHRSHNNPPELIGAEVQISSVGGAVVEQLAELEEELEKQKPEPSTLSRIASKLREIVASVTSYCAKLGDVAAQGAAKEIGSSIGKWAGPGLIIYLASPGEAISKLADAVSKFADKL